MPAQKQNLEKSLSELAKIVEWFEAQEDVDVEEGLNKVKFAAQLIKAAKKRLAEVENEFQEIQKEIIREIGKEYGSGKKDNKGEGQGNSDKGGDGAGEDNSDGENDDDKQDGGRDW